MNEHPTAMRREIEEIPAALRRLLQDSERDTQSAASELRQLDPGCVITVARGSSDHAAAYLKYAIELSAGVPVASMGPSIGSIYNAPLRLKNTAAICISQSGASTDIAKMAENAARGGATNIALTNTNRSLLAVNCAHTIPINAGPERSVAATKTFVNSVAAGLMLLAYWQEDEVLLQALRKLPEQAERAIACDWTALCHRLRSADSLFVLGRGTSLAIANEVALKFKETCQVHAESYSAAEVMHGPVSVVEAGFPVLALAARDATEQSVVDVADALVDKGAEVFITTARDTAAVQLPCVGGDHPLTDPLLLVVGFYSFVEMLARDLGRNPDVPPHLNKVTDTV